MKSGMERFDEAEKEFWTERCGYGQFACITAPFPQNGENGDAGEPRRDGERVREDAAEAPFTETLPVRNGEQNRIQEKPEESVQNETACGERRPGRESRHKNVNGVQEVPFGTVCPMEGNTRGRKKFRSTDGGKTSFCRRVLEGDREFQKKTCSEPDFRHEDEPDFRRMKFDETEEENLQNRQSEADWGAEETAEEGRLRRLTFTKYGEFPGRSLYGDFCVSGDLSRNKAPDFEQGAEREEVRLLRELKALLTVMKSRMADGLRLVLE